LSGYSGDIRLEGTDIRTLSRQELSRQIAYIPQSSSPSFNYSVFDVVSMGRTVHLKPGAMPSKKDDEIVFATLEDLGISYLADSGYAAISGGERQMALIARALVQQTRVLVMDEPTANLDFGNQFRVLEQVRKLKEAGYLIVMSTHNPQHVLSYATKVIVMHEGKVLAQGDPLDVLDERILEHVYGIGIEMIEIERRRNGQSARICLPAERTTQ
jgi:iron complex transport system ATP-binding protein